MWVIGDVHGKIDQYLEIIKRIEAIDPTGKSIQVGDMGIGFRRSQFLPYMESHRWFRGNHDNPEVSLKHPGHLGDFGVWEGAFYVAGAWSIDQDMRTLGLDWWDNEELTWDQWNKCLELYGQVRPELVVSHDCPRAVAYDFWKIDARSTTAQGLQAMFDFHQPKLWIFGHHHQVANMQTMGTRFVCVESVGYPHCVYNTESGEFGVKNA